MSTFSRKDALVFARNTGHVGLAAKLAMPSNSVPRRRARQLDPLAIPPSGVCAVSCYLPVEAVSILNKRMHPMKLHRMKDVQRATVRDKLRLLALPKLPIAVTLTRIFVGRQRKLDAHDNLPAAFKAIVDAIAELYGVSDNDPRVSWMFDQAKHPLPFPCVRVWLVPVEAAETGRGTA